MLVTDRRSVAANAKVDNVLSGSIYEFLGADSLVEFGLVASVVGLNATVVSGTDVLMDDQEVSAANRLGIYPDDFTLNDIAGEGERLKVGYRNTTGAAITAFTSVKITPI